MSSSGFKATINHVGILDVIQHLIFQVAGGRLAVTHGDQSGDVYLADGRFLHACVEGAEGPDALLEIVRWPTGDCVFQPGVTTAERSFPEMSGDRMLLETLRRLDESKYTGRAPVATPNETEVGDRAEDLIKRLAEMDGMARAGLLDHSLAVVAASDDAFASDRRVFNVLIETAREMSRREGRDETSYAQVYDDGDSLIAIRTGRRYVCCRTECTVSVDDVYAQLSV